MLCSSELRGLETVVKEVEPHDTSSNHIINKLGQGKHLLAYPFSRPNLVQVEDQLFRVASILNTVLQALALNINIGVANDVEKSTTAILDAVITTQESLDKVKSGLMSVSSVVERTDQRSGIVAAQLEGLFGPAQSASTPQEILHELIIKSTEQSAHLNNIE
ncbi:hypothetical protein B0J13DRAFT_528892 [Dactylonectria estremocensis]|uniref:Uncharacterized protein n=1 Tax=Dactylonectria estremocensis TaxID=1079267 RepID=A0A9P9E8Z4_9HYPO|nr:hypothetical protein B0J13DRAFT_528892 [Dactylonectria estremocensis]